MTTQPKPKPLPPVPDSSPWPLPWDRWCEAGSVLVLAGNWHDPEPEEDTP